MSDISFKKFVEYVNLDGDVSDAQINEIFGMFRNNVKLDKLKKEREKLKGMSSQKRAELDKALRDFADGKQVKITDRVKGAIKDIDWDAALDSADRKFHAKRDRAMATEDVRVKEPGFFVMDDTDAILKMDLDSAKKYLLQKIEDHTSAAPENVRKAKSMVQKANTVRALAIAVSNFILAHESGANKVLKLK